MRIPKTIRIDYKTYKVKQIVGKSFKAKTGKKKLVGEMDSTVQTIKLAKEQHPEEKANTLLHELLHACIDAEGLRVKNEENVVTKLANRLYQVITDNKLKF
jgi:Zn-dependent peptidase ImmA (M78 family)